jgi:hypothetical protein
VVDWEAASANDRRAARKETLEEQVVDLVANLAGQIHEALAERRWGGHDVGGGCHLPMDLSTGQLEFVVVAYADGTLSRVSMTHTLSISVR